MRDAGIATDLVMLCAMLCLLSAEIKMHPWFKDIDWPNLAKNKAAFIPMVEDPTDISYFVQKKPVSLKVGRRGGGCRHVGGRGVKA